MCRNVDQGIAAIRDQAAREMAACGIVNAQREAEWLLVHVTGRSRLDLIMKPDEPLSATERERLSTMVARRCAREPLQYITGTAAFYGRSFFVTPDVLIPRPETEELVEWILEWPASELTGGLVDLGTGSGCIPVSVALERKGVACTGVDLSAAALDVARRNAVQLGARVSWVEADMADPRLNDLVGSEASVLVSNPPYIPRSEEATLEPEVRSFEPGMALFSEPDPLYFYRVLTRQAPRLLRSGGHLLVEIHADAGSAVAHLFEEAGFRDVMVRQDMAGRDRMVHALVTASQRQAHTSAASS